MIQLDVCFAAKSCDIKEESSCSMMWHLFILYLEETCLKWHTNQDYTINRCTHMNDRRQAATQATENIACKKKVSKEAQKCVCLHTCLYVWMCIFIQRMSHETENSRNNLVFYARSTTETEKERGQERTIPKHVSPVRKTKINQNQKDGQTTDSCASLQHSFGYSVLQFVKRLNHSGGYKVHKAIYRLPPPQPRTPPPPPPPTSPAPLQKQPGTKTSLRQTNEPNCVKAMEQSAIPSTWWTWSPVHRAPCVAPSGHRSCWSQPPGVGSWLAPPQTGRWGTAHPCTTCAGRPVGSGPSEEATEQKTPGCQRKCLQKGTEKCLPLFQNII